MPARRKRSRIKRRRSKLRASNAGPILALGGTVLAVLAVIALIVFVALPRLMPLIGVEYQPPWQPTPTPAPTPRPTPTPHPAAVADLRELQNEVVLSTETYNWFSDPSVCGGELMFVAAGPAEAGKVHMNTLLLYDMEEQTAQRVNAKLENDEYISPVFNENWLVYLDAKETGGGVIRAQHCDGTGAIIVKEVYVGKPVLILDGDYLFWTERTGTRMDKLFGCDLNTLESVTVQMFSNSIYGLSKASAANGQLVYADEDPYENDGKASDTSAVYSINIDTGKQEIYSAGTYVHDPKTNGKQWAWLSGNHGEDSDLYCRSGKGRPVCIAKGVVDFAISDQFIAYGVNESIYVYFFDDKTTTCIIPEQERAQFLNVSDGYVLWMDVTSRERDILKYAEVK